MSTQTEQKPTVYIINGLFYGDEGKGTTVDYLTNKTNSRLVGKRKKKSKIKRYGGPQAMHNVITNDGIHHCFGQFGAGSLVKGTKTLLSKYMFIFPYSLIGEGNYLKDNIVPDIFDNLLIDKECYLITPLNQLVNRIFEMLRNVRYGTTGMGVGDCVDDSYYSNPLNFPQGEICYSKDKGKKQKINNLQIKDLNDENVLFSKIQQMYTDKMDIVRKILKNYKNQEFDKIYDENFLKLMKNQIKFNQESYQNAHDLFINFIMNHTVDSIFKDFLGFKNQLKDKFVDGIEIIKEELTQNFDVIFEGSQGALLDRIYGVYPHITKNICNDEPAIEIMKKVKKDFKMISIGALRCYSSRHGHGPLITENETWKKVIEEQHNKYSSWQGDFRIGPFDFVASNFGSQIYNSNTISLTCIDQIVNGFHENTYDFVICLKYKIQKIEENMVFLKNTKSEFYEEDDFIFLTKLNKGNFEDFYKEIKLFKLLQTSEPIYSTLEQLELNKLSQQDLKLKNKIEEYFQKNFENINEKFLRNIIQFIIKIQQKLKKPILFISFGPSAKHKIDLLL
eukprot:gene7003-11168_t